MNLIENLINNLAMLPGIGKKSAQRLTYNLLTDNKNLSLVLSDSLKKAAERVGLCVKCRNLTENELCDICFGVRGNSKSLCVLEGVADLINLENSKIFDGRYFILHGRLSPIDGIGEKEISLDKLYRVLLDDRIEEVIIATNSNAQSEVTAHFIENIIEKINQNNEVKIKVSKLARGLPSGGEIELLDLATLSQAFMDRK